MKRNAAILSVCIINVCVLASILSSIGPLLFCLAAILASSILIPMVCIRPALGGLLALVNLASLAGIALSL